MKIAVLGTGNVGRTLGAGWSKATHTVVYGTREPGAENEATMSDAIQDADVIVLALPYGVVAGVLPTLGDLTGRCVVDCTNPINADFSGLSIGHNTSGAEEIQALIPTAHVVKAFNTVGFNIMENPHFESGSATMLVAGEDPTVKATVLSLANDLGFEAIDAGPLIQARLLESFAWLWISMAVKYGYGRDIAFRFMRRG